MKAGVRGGGGVGGVGVCVCVCCGWGEGGRTGEGERADGSGARLHRGVLNKQLVPWCNGQHSGL